MAIKIEKLVKRYEDKTILNSLNLSIKKGTIFGLLGVNGAGKTTVLSILNYLIKKDSGSVKIYGKDLHHDKKEIKSFSSFVPQNFAFYPDLTGYENLEFFANMYKIDKKNIKTKIEEVAKKVSLEEELDKRAKRYSGGYKRRLNLAIGLLNNPKILYLDEPTVGVDAHTRGEIIRAIKDINQTQKTTIVYTSHYMEEIEHICDDIAILHEGEIIVHKPKLTLLKEHKSLEILFLELTKEDFIR